MQRDHETNCSLSTPRYEIRVYGAAAATYERLSTAVITGETFRPRVVVHGPSRRPRLVYEHKLSYRRRARTFHVNCSNVSIRNGLGRGEVVFFFFEKRRSRVLRPSRRYRLFKQPRGRETRNINNSYKRRGGGRRGKTTVFITIEIGSYGETI